MLSIILEKEKCIKTINTWKELRYDLRKIREFIRPFFRFQFEDQDSQGIKIDNVSVNFYTSIGIHPWIPLLISAPLTYDGFTYPNDFKFTSNLAHVYPPHEPMLPQELLGSSFAPNFYYEQTRKNVYPC